MNEDLEIHATGLTELIADFGKASLKALPEIEKVISKGALNIKQDAAQRASGLAHARAYPSSIGYDLYYLPGSIRARIGPDKDKRQGALGNLLEYGSVNNPPRPHLSPALDAEAPRTERAIADVAQRLLEPS